MLMLNGKYSTAKVFTDNIDSETISQIIELLNQEFVKDNKIRIMPDCHAGKGCVVGTTMTLTDKVVPNLVGVDIGCGMLAVKLEETDIDLRLLDGIISEYIPSGFSIHDQPVNKFTGLKDIICDIDIDKAEKSIGSLGGGNHFIEIDRDKNGSLWLVIHCGSRHLGIKVCNHYQDEGCKRPAIRNLKIPKNLAYVYGDLFENYIHDMKITQEYAAFNRMVIAETIIDKMSLHPVETFDTIHNYIDTENMILRKGSISAQVCEKVIIPMNMRDGSLICIGKGNPDWNYSAPHGAGRIMSRSQAKDNVDFTEYKNSMEGIYSTSVVPSTVDESPMVYKPMGEIMENIKETVDITDIIKPIYNFKAH